MNSSLLEIYKVSCISWIVSKHGVENSTNICHHNDIENTIFLEPMKMGIEEFKLIHIILEPFMVYLFLLVYRI